MRRLLERARVTRIVAVAIGSLLGSPAASAEPSTSTDDQATQPVAVDASLEPCGDAVREAMTSRVTRPLVVADVHLGPCHPRPAASEVSTTRRALAVSLAIVPGVVVRGAGSWGVGDRRTARRLALTGAIGLGAMLIGGLPIGITGGNPYVVVPGAPVAVAGAGLFFSSWFADVYRAAGGARTVAMPRARAPWSFEVGTTYTRDGLRQRALGHLGAQVFVDRVGLGVHGYLDAGGDAAAATIEPRVRMLGAPADGGVLEDGTRLEVRGAITSRRDRQDDVAVSQAELELIGRLDLRRISGALDGSFAELSTGFGIERVRYPGDATDLGSLLLGRFAWGAYLGHRGEATVFYDHRRDQLAGGIAAGRAAGFIGSVGANLDLRVRGPWAARAELEVGSAWVGTLALRFEGGAR